MWYTGFTFGRYNGARFKAVNVTMSVKDKRNLTYGTTYTTSLACEVRLFETYACLVEY